ncbi:GDP-mannose--glycolipid 4-beta-D-mannosyltransferase [soil metagenome]
MTPLRVMQSYPFVRQTTNPYIALLDRSLASTEGIEHMRFSWKAALFGRIDVLHLHWPETLFNSSTAVNRLVKRALVAALVLRLRLGTVAVVRTVHNIELPADVTGFQRMLLRQIERATDLRIRIGETTALPDNQPSVQILHGDYRSWFATSPRRPAVRGRLGFVGLIRRYKGVESLIAAFRAVSEQSGDLTLAISGQPTSESLAAQLRELAAPDSRITLRLGFLDDDEFVGAMTSSQLVVLPYRFMHNSGSVLAALSLDRAVLVPRNDANTALAREVGTGWVLMYDGDLDAEILGRAAEATVVPPDLPPDLSARGWDDVGQHHAAAYLSAVQLRSRRHRRAVG